MQAAHGQQPALRFSSTFDRCPVLVGRDGGAANCVLNDDRVSRVHASLDIRDDKIWVRDSGSTNGTFVNGSRIPNDRWVVGGPVERGCEISIGQWLIKVTAIEVSESEASMMEDFLVAVPPDQSHPLPPGTKLSDFLEQGKLSDYIDQNSLRGQLAARVQAPSNSGSYPGSSSGSNPGSTPGSAPFAGGTQVVEGSTLRIGRAWAMLVGARNGLNMAIAEVLEATPPKERAALVREIIRACEAIQREPGVQAIFERNGVPAQYTLESAALLSLQELARWYVNDQPPLRNASEVFTFARKVKAGIDELLLGLVPLFAGLDRFEQQMALRPVEGRDPDEIANSASRLPRVPRDAARRLFNWRDPSDTAVRAVRTDLVDLTMHQVAVLNGVMRGVKQLLTELSPETIEQALGRKIQKRGVFGRLFGGFRAAKERWDLFRERHGDLADEENERFRVIFGPEFVAEYKQSGETGGYTGRQPPPPPLPPAQPPPYGSVQNPQQQQQQHPPQAPWPPQHRPPDPTHRN